MSMTSGRCFWIMPLGAITHRQTTSDQQGEAKMETVNPMNRSAVEMAPVQAVTSPIGHPNNASMLTMKRRLLIKRKQRLLFCILRNWILILLDIFVALIAVILMLIPMLLQPCSVVIIPLDTNNRRYATNEEHSRNSFVPCQNWKFQ